MEIFKKKRVLEIVILHSIIKTNKGVYALHVYYFYFRTSAQNKCAESVNKHIFFGYPQWEESVPCRLMSGSLCVLRYLTLPYVVLRYGMLCYVIVGYVTLP